MKTARQTRAMDLGAILMILSVSAVIAYGYFTRVDKPNFASRLELHHHIITGTAPSPYRYRILVPFVGELFTTASAVVLPVRTSFLLVYGVYDLVAVFFLLASLFAWLRTWFTADQALIGVLFVAGTMPIALQNHYFQPWSLLEVGLLSTALIAIHRQRYWLLACLVALASLNKETAIFIPIAFLLTIDAKQLMNARSTEEWRPVVVFGALFLIWAIVFWGLRYVLGVAPHIQTIESVLAHNTTKDSLLRTLLNGSLFLGAWWIFALLGFRHAPQFIKRMIFIIPLYLITVLVWGVWYEVRLLMPLYPIIVPLGLSFLYRRESQTLTV
jgi:hypothetical protein